MKLLKPILLAAVFLLAPGVLAHANPACGPRTKVVEALKGKFKENSVGAGMSQDGKAVIERFSAKDGATWTILVTTANGLSCIVAAGKDWSETPVGVEGTDS